jgi:23S rRNA (pseudouridine1915-N3)-methyltransferase
MRILICAVGRLKVGPERELFERYAGRIGRSGRAIHLGPVDLVELMEDRAATALQRMRSEAQILLGKTDGADHRIALDERGEALTSSAFANLIGELRDRGVQRLAFLIGGADGHDPQVRDAVNCTISLGPMTLPHGLARIVLAEQIYRATTILSGHPYHRD